MQLQPKGTQQRYSKGLLLVPSHDIIVYEQVRISHRTCSPTTEPRYFVIFLFSKIFLPIFHHPNHHLPPIEIVMGRPAEVKFSAPPRVYRSSPPEDKRRTSSSIFAKYQVEVDSLLKALTTSASLQVLRDRSSIQSSSNSNSQEKNQHHTIMQCEKSETAVKRGGTCTFSKIVSYTNRRSVSFSLVEHDVRTIQRLEDEFRDDIWLHQDDFKRIKKEAISSLRRIERGEATQDDAVKGLEVRISDNAVCRNENRARGLREVLREQDRQRRNGTCDVQAIASTYKEISRPCHLTA
jgi:hypothetical protein